MTVEILHFEVEPERRSEFIRRNEEVWTPALRDTPGFVRREILVNDERAGEIVIVIYWRSRAHLDAFPEHEQKRLEARMADLVRGQDQRRYERVLPDEGLPLHGNV